MALTGLGPWKIVLAKGSSSHPGWIMHKKTCRDHDDSSSQPMWMCQQSSNHWSSTVPCVQLGLRTDRAFAFAQSVKSLCSPHKECLSYPMSAQWRLWLDWVDVQAYLSLHWVHTVYPNVQPVVFFPKTKKAVCWYCTRIERLSNQIFIWESPAHSDVAQAFGISVNGNKQVNFGTDRICIKLLFIQVCTAILWG